jgi:hypothetical protein
MTQPRARAPRGVRPGPAESNLVGRDDPDLVAYRDAQIAEYSRFIAAHQITTEDGVPIYNYGDHVPVSNVELHGYDKDGSVLEYNPDTAEYEEIKPKKASKSTSARSTSDGGNS